MRPILGYVLLAGAACVAAPSPPTYPIPKQRPAGGVAKAKNGHVLGSSVDQIGVAAELMLALNKYFDLVAERVGYRREEPFLEVWLDPEWAAAATTFDTCIVMNPCELEPGYAPGVLVHELVHWHTRRTALQRNLPQVAYEGLAHRIVAELVPGWDPAFRAEFRLRLDQARARGDLADLVSWADPGAAAWTTPPFDDRMNDLYALGFTLVDHIGVDALIAAAERGPVTLEELLEMSGVGADGTGL